MQVGASLVLPPRVCPCTKARSAPAPAEVVARSQRVPKEQLLVFPARRARLGHVWLAAGLSLILAEQMAQGRDIN